MYVSCSSSNTRVNRVALTVTSPHILLVRVLHQRESDAADARIRARHPRTLRPIVLRRTGVCREIFVSHSRRSKLKSRVETTATYNQRGAGGSAAGGLDGRVT
jgi:hypothetical protein